MRGTTAIELCLVELGGAFHYELLKQLIVRAAARKNGEGAGITSNDAAITKLYLRFHIGITAGDAISTPTGARLKGRGIARDTMVGYVTSEYVTIYDATALRWFNAPLSEFNIGRRHKENNIVVGFVVPIDESGTSSAAARFKLRPALQVLQRRHLGSAKTVDVRTIARGAVCETRPREELDGFVKKLRATLPRNSSLRASIQPDDPATKQPLAAALTPDEHTLDRDMLMAQVHPVVMEWPDGQESDMSLSFAVRYDRTREKRFPSASELCSAVRLYLLALEEHSRNSSQQSGLRWLYLFADKPPSVASLGTA
jgi:hypothetical protein